MGGNILAIFMVHLPRIALGRGVPWGTRSLRVVFPVFTYRAKPSHLQPLGDANGRELCFLQTVPERAFVMSPLWNHRGVLGNWGTTKSLRAPTMGAAMQLLRLRRITEPRDSLDPQGSVGAYKASPRSIVHTIQFVARNLRLETM